MKLMTVSAKPGKSVMMLDKKPSAGGDGGGRFDSGCNPSGVTKVTIECGSFHWRHRSYRSTIKRVLLDFNVQNHEKKNPGFWGHPVDKGSNKTFTFEPANDSIVKVVVWSDGVLANAVQFHLASGHVSEMFGIPGGGAKPTEYCGGNGSQLVGVYGKFGGVIDSLGFAFAAVTEGVPHSVNGSWVEETEDESLSLVSYGK